MNYQTVVSKHELPNCHVLAWATKLSCPNMNYQTVVSKHEIPNCRVLIWITKEHLLEVIEEEHMKQKSGYPVSEAEIWTQDLHNA